MYQAQRAHFTIHTHTCKVLVPYSLVHAPTWKRAGQYPTRKGPCKKRGLGLRLVSGYTHT